MLFTNAYVWKKDRFEFSDCVYSDGMFDFSVPSTSVFPNSSIFDSCIIFPGFCDVHVHLREPGFSYKETVKSGTMSAARGGYTAVCSMPNLNPVPDSLPSLKLQLDAIKRDAVCNVIPYGALTVGEKGEQPSDLEGMANYVVAFSDDGRGVQSESMMRSLMEKAKSLGKTVVAHCEVNSLLNGGYIHQGTYAKQHGHRGICSESEWRQVERDLRLAKETGCSYHVCHISTKESVALIRKARAEGVDASCETAPHYLTLSDKDLKEEGRFKMNPPLRDESDRVALIDGVLDGTIEIIATDHAPHSQEEKSRGLEKSLFGIVGLETAFPILYTKLVKTNILSLEKLVELLSINPRKRFNINSDAGYCVWDVKDSYTLNSDSFLSMGKATPWEGEQLYGKNILTVYNNKEIYKI